MAGEFRVLHPCARDRESLAGEGAVRWCPDCRKNVYDFAQMRRREVDRVVASGDCCGIVERRADGTLWTADPPPLRRRFLRWFTAFAGAGARWAWAQQAPLPQGKGGVRGEVVDAADVAVAKARVTAGAHGTVTDADGRFVLIGLAPGSVGITVEHDGFGPTRAQVLVTEGKFTTLAPIRLWVGGTGLSAPDLNIKPVAVVVTDATGSGVPTALVALHDQAGNVVKELRNESSAMGHYALSSVEPGIYTLTVECAGFKKYRRPLEAPTTHVVLEVGSVGDVIYIEPNPVRRLVNRLRRL